MRLFPSIVFISILSYTNATTDFTLPTGESNFWGCDGQLGWIRSSRSTYTRGRKLTQTQKATCLYSPSERLPVCLAVSLDSSVWEYTLGHWTPAFLPKIPIDGSFSCVLTPVYEILCFTRGGDGAIWKTTRRAPVLWTDLQSVGGEAAEAPSCVMSESNRGVCFYKGLNGIAYYSAIDKITWTEVDDTLLASEIRCFNDVKNTVSCVALNGVSQVVIVTWNGTVTTSWTSLGLTGKLVDPPSCVMQSLADRVDCVGRRAVDNQLVFSRRQDGVWSEWARLELENVYSRVECTRVSTMKSACFYIGDEMRLKSRAFIEGQWKKATRYNLIYIEEPACAGVRNGAVLCMGRAVPDVSKLICENLNG
eukprot:g7515.t1